MTPTEKETLKNCYQIGDLVVDDNLLYGIVIKVTRNVLTVKNQYSTSEYKDIQNIGLFKNELKVKMHIGTVINKCLS